MSRNSRRGVSLVEMVVVMTFSTSLVVAAAGLIHVLLEFQKQRQTTIEQARSLDRLAPQFREDVHAAVEFRRDVQGNLAVRQLRLADGGRIEYSFAEGRVIREEREGDALRRRETYKLPEAAIAGIDYAPDGDRLLRLAIDGPSAADIPSGVAPVRPVRIDAALGRDLRYQKEPAQ